MRIFKTKPFSRYARKEGISDDELRAIVPQLEENNPDANLGGDVFKMRVPRPYEGKSGGYRLLVFFRRDERTFFFHGFAKSDLSNIKEKELAFLKMTAKAFFAYTENDIVAAIRTGKLVEITEG